MTSSLSLFESTRDEASLSSLHLHATLATMIDRLDAAKIDRTGVIKWSAPIPVFGALASTRVATLGINPSNREFVDESGQELDGHSRRFHSLNSLGLRCWSDADASHLRLILDSCHKYFYSNPYGWFKKLDVIISGTGASYYSQSTRACHLDLIPYATAQKWTNLSVAQRSELLQTAADTVAHILKDSDIELLVLNGKSVVDHFELLTAVKLDRVEMRTWALPRSGQRDVIGVAYTGWVDALAGVSLNRRVLVLGYNHNIQSSFGVTGAVIRRIRQWIQDSASGLLGEQQRENS